MTPRAPWRDIAQVRVMPRCWFVLLRYWLRLDGVLMRLREVRGFHNTSAAARASPKDPGL